MPKQYFSSETFDFLSALSANNNRDWFNENKQRYEDAVRTPALNFITDIANELPIISEHFLAVPKKMGGSLMRVYRDTRFGNDKRPYKTNIGIHFRHEVGKNAHAPGFYLHIEPGDCFIGAGIWRPDSASLYKIREAIIEKDAVWTKISRDKAFLKKYKLSGESLRTAPRGFSRDHPMIEDLRRKDFIARAQISEKDILSKQLLGKVSDYYLQAGSYMAFLCKALGLRY